MKLGKAEQMAEQSKAILVPLGYDLADMELVKEGANLFARFFIEHHGDEAKPITHDDCQRASEALAEWLDKADPLPQAYFLEVSSPGIERPLKQEKDFQRFTGRLVMVHTYKLLQKRKKHIGQLGLVTAQELTLVQSGGNLVIPRDSISNVHLYWDENQGGMKGQ